ncbi:DUF1993 domain-containing protein [Luteimonas sp. 50]|uniref:DUF1993 domain-containing protein n=1 Tax=Cognatiluteimonas sedimenti TaxID=2927791 RepID=A0ABT0A0Q4_9GAMM|nr:DUF1993 domain-containing protein [Lysobacter sedimenti]MCJ0824554.1 DUF1993 domain-containing protein [Lysobacter sedimenti]
MFEVTELVHRTLPVVGINRCNHIDVAARTIGGPDRTGSPWPSPTAYPSSDPPLPSKTMANQKIIELQRVFASRLAVLGHLLDVGEQHFADPDVFLGKRLAADMLPFSAQVAFACNAPRGFSQWCAGEPIENLRPDDIRSLPEARAAIAQTQELVAGIAIDDAKLDEAKRIGLGPGRYCELPGHQYVADYLLPNLYFHVTTAYAILRLLGAPLGKADYLGFLAPLIRHEGGAGA